MSKSVLSLSEVSSSLYIQQIAAQEGTYDLVPAHKITFFNGQKDSTGVEWDGIRDLEVVIPSLADLIQDPIRFAGTVGSDGIAKDINGDALAAKKGDLVYMTADCEFNGVACEAGDMAICTGLVDTKPVWNIVSGENQVTILGTFVDNASTFKLTGTAASVLTVEGKTLKLAIDYADVRSNITVAKNDDVTRNLQSGLVSVSGMTIALVKAKDGSDDISESVSISLPTALADGTVAVSENVLVADDFTFASGSFPTISKNAAATLSTTHNMSIAKQYDSDGVSGDYVTAIDAIKAVSIVDGTENEFSLKYMTGISASDGASFVNGIHTWTVKDAENPADFTIPGAISAPAASNTFATGFGAAASTGDVVSSVAVGAVTIEAGEGLLTGVDASGSDFVSSVTFGDVVEDTSDSLFVKGLSDGNDVVTHVSVGAVSFVSDANSGFKAPAVISAVVSEHVLSFTTAPFMTPVGLSKEADDIQKRGFVKSGVSLVGFSSTMAGFTTGSLSQASTEVSFKELKFGSVTLSQDADIKYYLDKDATVVYKELYGYKKLDTTAATVSKNSPVLDNTTITVNVPANTYAVSLEGGELPSLDISAATGKLHASVGTSLSVKDVSWLAINPEKKDIAVAGAYSLTSASDAAGAITVASAGDYAVSGSITIASGTFLTDAYVAGSLVGTYVAPVQPEQGE